VGCLFDFFVMQQLELGYSGRGGFRREARSTRDDERGAWLDVRRWRGLSLAALAATQDAGGCGLPVVFTT
jgi:hypothetical protein